MSSFILTAWVALAVAAISPGPNLVAVASRALGSGRNAALHVAAGLATGAFLWSFLTAVGLGALFDTYPVMLRLMGLFGGAYLFWLGLKGWRAVLTGQGGQIAPAIGQGARQDFLHGFTVTVTNPKVALLWASLSTFVGSEITDWPALLLFTMGSAIIAFFIYGTYGWFFSIGGIRDLYSRFHASSEAIFGTLFCGLGMVLVHRSL